MHSLLLDAMSKAKRAGRKAQGMHMLQGMSSPMMYETRNITFRLFRFQADLLDRAAKHSGKTTSEYIRDLIVPQAAKDLGEEVPPMLMPERGRYGSPEAKAAKALGVSREELRELATQDFAARILAEKAEKPEKPSARSGERPAVKARSFGSYAGAPGEKPEARPGRRGRAGGE
jgi:hypothetical protein